MSQSGAITGIDLTDDSYTVEQGLVRSKYKAMDADGNVVLRAKKKLVSVGDTFPFQDDDGNDVFEVSSEFGLNTKRDYILRDAQTEDEVVLLDDKLSLFSQKWQLRDPDSEDVIATIETKNKLVAFLRPRLSLAGKLLPREFEIESADGQHIGTIEGQLSLNDTYEINIDDTHGAPREAIVAAAMVIDAIEGN
jgi:uncharacterized protein YxjI